MGMLAQGVHFPEGLAFRLGDLRRCFCIGLVGGALVERVNPPLDQLVQLAGLVARLRQRDRAGACGDAQAHLTRTTIDLEPEGPCPPAIRPDEQEQRKRRGADILRRAALL